MQRAVLLAVSGLLALLVARPVESQATSGAPQDFETIKYLQQISRDTLKLRPDAMRDTEVGPHVAVDPNDPLRIVTVFQQSRFGGGAAADNGFATSHDGGQTWVTAPMPHLTVSADGEWKRAGDPTVAFGPDGAVYASALVYSNLFCPSGVAVQRSDDGGLTWNDPVVIQINAGEDRECPNFNEKDWLAVDTYPASPFFGRIYVAWLHRVVADRYIVLKWSDDRGETWSELRRVSPLENSGISPVAIVQPNGDLTIVYSDWFDDLVFAQTSRDGGLTFGPPTLISTYEGVDPPDMWTGALNDRVSASVDPTTRIIYVAWQDGRFRDDKQNDVVLTTSSDGGATWSEPRRVNQDPLDDRLDHLTPAIAAHGGFLHITYVFRDAREGLNQEVSQHYIVSADGGVSFSSPLELGRPTDLTWSARVGIPYDALLGEYMGMAATESFAYVAWPRASTPKNIERIYHQTMWSATIER